MCRLCTGMAFRASKSFEEFVNVSLFLSKQLKSTKRRGRSCEQMHSLKKVDMTVSYTFSLCAFWSALCMSNTISMVLWIYFLNVVLLVVFFLFMLYFENATQDLSDVWKCEEYVKKSYAEKTWSDLSSTSPLSILQGCEALLIFTAAFMTVSWQNSPLTFCLNHKNDLFLYLISKNEPCA